MSYSMSVKQAAKKLKLKALVIVKTLLRGLLFSVKILISVLAMLGLVITCIVYALSTYFKDEFKRNYYDG